MQATRILIVEDETIVALDVQTRLNDLGYEVTGVADRGDEALALVATTLPDLVLMDIRLKGEMDGIAAAEEIRRRWRIPVVYLTAFSEDSTLQRAKVTEPFGYIIKPFEDREIQSVIEMALYKHQAEQRLRQSERRYATTLASIGDGVIATDSLGAVTFMNPVAEKLTGWSLGDAHGRPLTEVFRIINEQTRQVAEDPVAKVLREGKTIGLANHTLLISRHGCEIPIDDCAAPILDDFGTITGTVLVFQDVTERRRAAREREQALALLEAAIAQSPSGILVADAPDVTIRIANPAALGIRGESDQPLTDIAVAEHSVRWQPFLPNGLPYPSEDLPLSRAILKGEVTRNEELIIRNHEGEDRWVTVNAAPVKNSEGEITAGIVVFHDITERKQAEHALRESEERYRLLFGSINDAVFVHGVGSDGSPGQFIEVNDIACRRLGYTREELLQMVPTDVDAPETLVLLPAILQRLSAEGHAVWEGVHLTKEGRRIPVEISDRLFELRGETVGLATVRDISKRKAGEDENRRLRNYLANIIDSMPSVLVGVDMNGCVTQWNAAAQQRTGISAKEAKGQPVDLVLPALSGELDKVKEAVRSRMVKSENRVPKIAGGQMKYLDVTVYPLVSNGLEGAVIRLDDVTERVQIEEMMIQSDKMLSVGGLAAGMAHEINNPLGAILQASQNVLRRVSPDLPVNLQVAKACGTTLDTVRSYLEQREVLSFLEDIRNSGLRAAQIVENMLAFSRKPEAGGSSTDLAELLDRTLVLAGSDYDLKKRYDFRQIEIARDYAPDTPPVICQAGKLQQVFFNILRNGAEAMREVLDSGRVPRFVLRVLPEENMVRVEIEDNGPGMDEATRKRIFEPFFTTKPPGSGTGLGLSISYFIVTEDHGGTLSVESQPETGTRFVVRLPVGEKP